MQYSQNETNNVSLYDHVDSYLCTGIALLWLHRCLPPYLSVSVSLWFGCCRLTSYYYCYCWCRCYLSCVIALIALAIFIRMVVVVVVIVVEIAVVVTDVIVVVFVVVLLADMFENIVNGTRFGGASHTPMLTVRMCRSTQQFGFIRFPKNEEHKCHAIQNTYDNTLSNILMLHISIGFVVPCLFVFRQFSCIVYIQHRSGSLRSPCEGCKVSQGSSSTVRARRTVGPGVGCKKKTIF